jgi:hypothetical protein
MQTLPAYAAYLGSQGYSQSTQEKYFADIKKFSLFLRDSLPYTFFLLNVDMELNKNR